MAVVGIGAAGRSTSCRRTSGRRRHRRSWPSIRFSATARYCFEPMQSGRAGISDGGRSGAARAPCLGESRRLRRGDGLRLVDLDLVEPRHLSCRSPRPRREPSAPPPAAKRKLRDFQRPVARVVGPPSPPASPTCESASYRAVQDAQVRGRPVGEDSPSWSLLSQTSAIRVNARRDRSRPGRHRRGNPTPAVAIPAVVEVARPDGWHSPARSTKRRPWRPASRARLRHFSRTAGTPGSSVRRLGVTAAFGRIGRSSALGPIGIRQMRPRGHGTVERHLQTVVRAASRRRTVLRAEPVLTPEE